MIGALIALISLDMTRKLVAASMVASAFTVVGATNATPIVLEFSAAHKLTRPVHAVVSGVSGNDNANGVWVMTPTDTTHVALSTFTRMGVYDPAAGSGVYTSGGIAQTAFPDGSILLGRRNVALQTAAATPRILFVPMNSPEWGLNPYGGFIPPATLPRRRSAETDEQQFMKLQRQLWTEQHRFEVHVTGCASPPDPDFGDFDVTQALYQSLAGSLFELITPPRAKILGGRWVSQEDNHDMQLLDVRGQKWVGIVQIDQPVLPNPLEFVPASTGGTIIVNFINGASSDDTVLQIIT